MPTKSKVIEGGRGDRQRPPLDAGVVEPVKQAAQLSDAAVVGDLEDQVVIGACGGVECSPGGVQGIGRAELELDMATGDASLEVVRRAFGDDPATVEDRDPVS